MSAGLLCGEAGPPSSSTAEERGVVRIESESESARDITCELRRSSSEGETALVLGRSAVGVRGRGGAYSQARCTSRASEFEPASESERRV